MSGLDISAILKQKKKNIIPKRFRLYISRKTSVLLIMILMYKIGIGALSGQSRRPWDRINHGRPWGKSRHPYDNAAEDPSGTLLKYTHYLLI